MSHYIDRLCPTHGEWQMDSDNPGDCPQCPDPHARIAALEAQVAALAGALRDIEDDHCRACNAWATADAALTAADATHLAQLDAARREVCRVACAYLDSPVPSLWIGDLSQAVLALHEVENRQPAERGEGE